MNTPPSIVTRSQVNKLGQRLKRGESPSDEDLELLAQYQRLLESLSDETTFVVRRAFNHALPGVRFQRTARAKTLRSIVLKLQRLTTQLSNVQDLVGFRVVVPTALDLENVLTYIPLDDTWRVIDRRSNPSHGYRAVHIVHRNEMGWVECQLRTVLQHQWAELSEAVDHQFPGTKYGKGGSEAEASVEVELLRDLSGTIQEMEDLELERYPEDKLIPLRRQLIELLEGFRSTLTER